MFQLVKRDFINVVFLIILLAVSFVVCTSLGTVSVPFKDTVLILSSKLFGFGNPSIPEIEYSIIFKIRVPRVILGMVVGASLSISGLVFQALLKNPLADPYTLGISAGASFGAGLSILLSYILGSYFRNLLPLFAFLGGVSTVFLVYFLAKSRGRIQILTIILSGVIVSYLFSSGLVLIMSLLGDRSHEIIYWLMGSLSGYHKHLLISVFVIITLIIFTFTFFRDLDLISLGDEQAKSLGVNIEVVRLTLFSTTSLITSIAVSLSGTIGFVGLIVPHSMRLIFGPQHRKLIPACTVAGAIFLPLSDTLARIVPGLVFKSGMEIPVGVVTSLFGSPFFVFLLVRGKKSFWF